MSKVMTLKISEELLKELNGYYGMNAVTELKAIAKEAISLWPDYEKTEIHMGRVVGEKWEFEKIISSDELDALEKEIDSWSPEQRERNLQECLKKLPAVSGNKEEG